MVLKCFKLLKQTSLGIFKVCRTSHLSNGTMGIMYPTFLIHVCLLNIKLKGKSIEYYLYAYTLVYV